jgi:hypothetical protein
MGSEKNIYKMKLHEVLDFNDGTNNYSILRVAGGWLYFARGIASTFVSFDNEFLTIEENEYQK